MAHGSGIASRTQMTPMIVKLSKEDDLLRLVGAGYLIRTDDLLAVCFSLIVVKTRSTAS